MKLRLATVLATTLILTACGFHLRRNADLPAGMQRVHLSVSGDSDFRRELARAVTAAGSTVVDESGPGVAELRVPRASFSTNALTVTGQGRISAYAVLFHVEFHVADDQGTILVPDQRIEMSREFTYDARQAMGRGTQVKVLRESLVQDMVRAVMFRLQAAAAHPAPAASAATAATASGTG